MRRLIILAAALAIGSALAIEPPKTDKPPPAPAGTTPPTAPAPAAEPSADPQGPVPAPAEPEAEEEEETLPPLPDDAEPAGPPAARFNPTEKVRADFPVSFPIDI